MIGFTHNTTFEKLLFTIFLSVLKLSVRNKKKGASVSHAITPSSNGLKKQHSERREYKIPLR